MLEPDIARLVQMVAKKAGLSRDELWQTIEQWHAASAREERVPAQPRPQRRTRQAPRFKFQCRIFFSCGELEGEGTVSDLSRQGCRVWCETLVEPGMELRLVFFLPDHAWPLKVDRAIVRWTRGEEFGVEFLALRPAQRERLRLFLGSLESKSAR